MQYISEQCDRIVKSGSSTEADLQKIVSGLKQFVPSATKPDSLNSNRSKSATAIPRIDTENLSTNRSSSTRSNYSPGDQVDSPSLSTLDTTERYNKYKTQKIDYGEDVWAAIAVRDAEVFSEEQRMHYTRLQEQKKSLKYDLDSQVLQHREIERRKKDDDRRASEFIKAERERFNREQEEQEKTRLNRIWNEKKIRDDQLQAANQRRMSEDDRRKREEEQNVQDLKKRINKERMKEQQKRKMARDEIQQFLSYNETLKHRKAEIAKEEQELDRLTMEENNKRMERQEKQRELEFRKMYERQAKAMAMGSKLQVTLEEKARDDERKAQMEQEEQQRRREYEHQIKLEKLMKDNDNVKSTLATQIQARQNEIKHLLDERQREKELLELQLEQAKQEEAERIRRKREAAIRHRQELESQIRTSKRDTVYMTDEEKKLNAKLLQQLTLDGY
jgi:hypothetical protein